MKKWIATLAALSTLACAMPSQAHEGMAFRRGPAGHGGPGMHGGGHRGGWIGPALAGAVVGGVIYAATRPVLAAPVVVPPPVVVNPNPYPVTPVAYYCVSYDQYYPNVQTCPVPWQMVNY